ncbi:MAG: glycosyltransferase family A protein [Hyphomonas sp.]|uniref:glycosyltransferase family 2 protein n=1 Tax=Hyphomonas sp. TaxID=87 RepID=UPI003529B997
MNSTPELQMPSVLTAGTEIAPVCVVETCNGVVRVPDLSICVPAYHDDPSVLIRTLAQLAGAGNCEVLIYDDGSNDPVMTAAIEAAVQSYPGPARHLNAMSNSGRSAARNRLVETATSDWILFIDADMLPDEPTFLTAYLEQIEANDAPSLIAGGFSLKQARPCANQKLHAAQAKRSDCVSASRRARDPGRFVFTSNIVVHKRVLDAIGFDEQFTGWGWEDVDWGLRVSEAFPILHIDNTATHLGLESDDVLLRKFGTSGQNYARLVHNHPAAARRMKLTLISALVRNWPLLAGASRSVALDRKLPLPVRLFALKLYRARMYANYL